MTLIACWNVNSINTRVDHVSNWIRTHNPDILLLQELKCLTEAFPRAPFEDLGYNLAIHGQKSYNGVAILSKQPIEDVNTGLSDDNQSRYIEAMVGKFRVVSVYVPNGQEVGSDKFEYKLRFLDHFTTRLQKLLKYEEALVIGGDFNIAPFMDDVPTPEVLKRDRILCSKSEREALRKILNMGFIDGLRTVHPTQHQLFTWWDYRAGSWEQNKGYRIDHFLLSPQAADLLENADVDTAPRGLEKPSDHAPIWVKLRD
jgi:exodeoxyribonuclease-3